MVLLIFSMPGILAIKVGHKFTQKKRLLLSESTKCALFQSDTVKSCLSSLKAADMFSKSTGIFCITQQNNESVLSSKCGGSCSLFLHTKTQYLNDVSNSKTFPVPFALGLYS